MLEGVLLRVKVEPARALSLVSAVIALGIAFGLNMTVEQTGSILAVVAILVGEGIRGKVSPVSEVDVEHETHLGIPL